MNRWLARARSTSSVAAIVLWLALPAAAESGTAELRDPGFEFELDLANNRLRVRDVRDVGALRPGDASDADVGDRVKEFRVAVGSPAHPTPRGRFQLGRVILRPAWTPGESAAAAGAESSSASLESPMGVAKIPFAQGGAIALHGGGDPDVLGKPVSSGCVRASDADLLRLIAWLHLRGALAGTVEAPNGELLRDFQRPARLRIF